MWEILRHFIVHKISFKAVSVLPSVTESDIERHLQAENILFCESFALEQQNYAHYRAFQHVNLQSLRKEDKEKFNGPEGKGVWFTFYWMFHFSNVS